MLWIHREPTTGAGVRAARGARSRVIELSDEALEGWDVDGLLALLSTGLCSALYVVGEGQRERGCTLQELDTTSAALKSAHDRYRELHERHMETLERNSQLEERLREAELLSRLGDEDEDEDEDENRGFQAALISLIIAQLRSQGVEIPEELMAHLSNFL